MSELTGHALCCPDKFRGSIAAPAAAEALAAGVEEAGLSALAHPLADGGEGTLDVILAAVGGSAVPVIVPDALGRERSARIGLLPDGSALVESAEAVGLAHLGRGERDATRSSTRGVGRMIRRALELGVNRVIVALGGTATMDGGLGALRELGARLLDSSGHELRGCGADLTRLERIDASRLLDCGTGRLEIAVDAWCPLHGPDGTAAVFGPQKGADPGQVRELDQGFCRLTQLLGIGHTDRQRLGTGGGFAAPFHAYFGARVHSGAEFVRKATDHDGALEGAFLCITGEGSVDRQSGLGKTVDGVIDAARRRSVPTVVVGGAFDEEASCLYRRGAAAMLPIGRRPRSWNDAKVCAPADLREMGRALGGLVAAVSRTTAGSTPRRNASQPAWFPLATPYVMGREGL